MGDEVGNALAQAALDKFDRSIGGAGSAEEAAVLDATLGIGGVIERQGGETGLHQTVDKAALQILAVVVGRLYGGRLRQQHEHVELRGLDAGSRGKAHGLFRILGDGEW